MTNSWMNEDGEPIMDGAAWRFECQLDSEAADEARMAYDDEFYADAPDEVEHHALDYDDTNEAGDPWCYGCDDYAQHGNLDNRNDDPIEDQWLDGSWEE